MIYKNILNTVRGVTNGRIDLGDVTVVVCSNRYITNLELRNAFQNHIRPFSPTECVALFDALVKHGMIRGGADNPHYTGPVDFTVDNDGCPVRV